MCYFEANAFGLCSSNFLLTVLVLQIYCCVGALAITHTLHHVNADLLGWWLCERQLPSGGLNGRPEKLPDVCYSWWVLASLKILGRLNWIDKVWKAWECFYVTIPLWLRHCFFWSFSLSWKTAFHAWLVLTSWWDVSKVFLGTSVHGCFGCDMLCGHVVT